MIQQYILYNIYAQDDYQLVKLFLRVPNIIQHTCTGRSLMAQVNIKSSQVLGCAGKTTRKGATVGP